MAGDGSASMFAGQPPPVEFHHRGIWYSGELLGWRHEVDGRVTARVRCRVDGLRHSFWMDLASLRLPDPRHPPHKEPLSTAVRRPTPAGSDEDVETRPHALLAGMGSRPAKPAHATRPPARSEAEPAEPEPRREPAHSERRNRRRHEASLGVG